MCERLEPKNENENPEVTRKRFDASLSVKRWRITPDDTDRYAEAVVDEGAPWWWEGDAEASDSFLEAMGVSL
jgi:hypothetical protein